MLCRADGRQRRGVERKHGALCIGPPLFAEFAVAVAFAVGLDFVSSPSSSSSSSSSPLSFFFLSFFSPFSVAVVVVVRLGPEFGRAKLELQRRTEVGVLERRPQGRRR